MYHLFLMNAQELRQVAWIGDAWVRKPVRGVVLSFHGLGSPAVKSQPTNEELGWSQAGGLAVYPYYGPWSWMNRQSRALVDEIVESVYRVFKLKRSVPLVCTGGSMGGGSALLYTRYAKRPVAACLAMVPMCDAAYHFDEREDLPRTFRHAFLGYRGSLRALLAEHSPLAQVRHLPRIPYRLVAGDADAAVCVKRHARPMVKAMRSRRLDVTYVEVPRMGHGGPMPVSELQANVDFVTKVFV
jgi:alpha-beta hydrolase superfamily lysophospholipase